MSRQVDRALRSPHALRGSALARLPEDQWFDRKSARTQARDLADALVGMANAEGGTLVVGLHAGKVEGVRRAAAHRHNDWRQAMLDYTVPPVRARFSAVGVINDEGHDDEVLVVEVDPSDRVHANQRDEVFLRIVDENRRLTFAQRQELEFDKRQSSFEATAARQLDRADLDEAFVADFADRVGHPDPTRLLSARGLLTRDGRLTVGGALLFSHDPQAELPEAYVRVLRYRGTGRGTGRRQQIMEDLRVEGPLRLQIRDAHEAVGRLVPTRRALSREGVFTEVGAVPRDAWLEGLVNAVTHRSYSFMGDHIRVEIFDDRVEIESPGRFPGLVDLARPREVTRFARNPRIARVLADLDFGQELGEGIRRMFDEMRLAGLTEPSHRQTSGSVRLSLSADPVDRALEDRLPPTARSLVRAIREHERVSTGDAVAMVGRSRPAVLRDLRALEEAGIIERIGAGPKDPRAFWQIAERTGSTD